VLVIVRLMNHVNAQRALVPVVGVSPVDVTVVQVVSMVVVCYRDVSTVRSVDVAVALVGLVVGHRFSSCLDRAAAQS
jgi:hypothetical protein